MRLVIQNAPRSLGMPGQTLTAPYCDRVVGIASVYPVSQGTRIESGRSRLIGKSLVAEEVMSKYKWVLVCSARCTVQQFT